MEPAQQRCVVEREENKEMIGKDEQPGSKKYEHLVLIYGMQRSGTSLLASYLGNHPDINMFYEATKDIFRYSCGRPIVANKLVNTQIRFNRKANWFIYKLNWIIRHIPFFKTKKGFWYWRPFSQVTLSIKDYIDMGAKIIIINRNKEDIFKSMQNRVGYSLHQFEKEYKEFQNTIVEINNYIPANDNLHTVDYEELCAKKEKALKEICNFLKIEYSDYMLLGEQRNYGYLKK